MRALKIYLWVVTTLLVLALGCGVYVWYVFQDFNKNMKQSGTEAISVPPTPDVVQPVSVGQETVPPEPLVPANANATVTIPSTALTSTQRSLLATFGIDEDSFTVTPAMIQCAKEAVGEERFAALIDGAAPTTRESLILLPCVR